MSQQSRAVRLSFSKTVIGSCCSPRPPRCAGCGRSAGDPLAPAQARGPVAVRIATAVGRDEPVTIEATGSFQADESSDVAPEASGRVIATPVDVGQSVQQGSVLVRIQGVDANLRLDEARAAAARAEANVKLAESQHQLALTTTQRYQSLLATGDVSRTVADQAQDGSGDEPAERQHRARVAGRGPGAARARRKGGHRRRGARAVLRRDQRPPGVARRIRAAVESGGDAAEDRPAAPAADDSQRAGRRGRARPAGDGNGRRLPGRDVHRPHQRGEPGDLRRIARVHASKPRCATRRRGSSRACSRWPGSIRARRRAPCWCRVRR